MKLIPKQWNLEVLKSKLRLNYPQLTEKDLYHEEGKEYRMFRMVAYKLHKTKPEMREIIDFL